MLKKTILAVALATAVAACATTGTQLTPMELQALQQREYETSKEVAFQAVVSVFQDLGYTINSADLATGFVTAASTSETRTDWLFTGARYTSQTRATATVNEGPGFARVRLNFVAGTATSSMYGQSSQSDNAIHDPEPYQNAFERIENAIFMIEGTTSS